MKCLWGLSQHPDLEEMSTKEFHIELVLIDHKYTYLKVKKIIKKREGEREREDGGERRESSHALRYQKLTCT